MTTVLAGQYTMTALAGEYVVTAWAGQYTMTALAGEYVVTAWAGQYVGVATGHRKQQMWDLHVEIFRQTVSRNCDFVNHVAVVDRDGD